MSKISVLPPAKAPNVKRYPLSKIAINVDRSPGVSTAFMSVNLAVIFLI